MFKKGVILFIMVFIVASLSACGNSTGGDQDTKANTESTNSADKTDLSSDEGKPVVLKFGHIVKPDGPVAKAAVRFSELVEERTSGKVKIEVYGSSQLGSQRDLLEGLQIGTVDITASSPAIISAVVPEVSVLDLPYMFSSKEQAYSVLDGELGKEIFANLEGQGYTCIGVWENGFRHITNSKVAIHTPEDLEGLKIRVPESDVYLEMMKALGAMPTPMAFGELFTALQNGTVDGQENPVSQIYASKFNEVQQYMTLDGHIYATNPVLISNSAMEKIPEDMRQIVLDTCKEVTNWQRQLVAEKEDAMLKEMEDSGMEITKLTDEELAKFKEKVAPVWEMFEDEIGKDLIDKVANYQG